MFPTISLRPLAARIAARFDKATIEAKAYRKEVLEPAVTSDRPPAIALPGEFDRARKFYVGRDFERARVAGGPRPEGATIAYELRDAVIARGVIYRGLSYESYRADRARFILTGTPTTLDEALLATSPNAEKYFGDWLIEALSLELLAQERSVAPISFQRPPWLNEPDYRALAGLHTAAADWTRVGSLWIVDDRGMNRGRGERLRKLRARIRAAAGPAIGPEKVYLARGQLGSARRLINDRQLEDLLAREGFAIVHPEQASVPEMAALLAHARVAVCLEGSAQMHAVVALPPSATLVILQPPDRFTAPGKDVADLAGLHYAYTVCDPAEGGFTADLERLRRTLELVERLP